LTVVSIAAGVATIVATSTVSNSVLVSFERMVTATAGQADLQLTNGGIGVPEELAEGLLAAGEVASVSSFIEGFVPLASEPARTLSIFGFDVLADEDSLSRVPRSAIDVPDEAAFIMNQDSIAMARSFARSSGYNIGSSLEVITPFGRRSVVVRALVDDVGPVALFGGSVGLMDISGAQSLLGREGRVDRIDVRLAAGADSGEATEAIQRISRGRARVHSVVEQGTKARDLLGSMRVVLVLAGAIAVVVAFFIIYHTVEVSLAQRGADIGLLSALGLSTWSLAWWVIMEALVLSGLGSVAGVMLGLGLARASVSLFGTVASAWVAIAAAEIDVSLQVLGVATAVGMATTVAATMLAARWILTRPTYSLIRQHAQPTGLRQRTSSVVRWGCLALALSLSLVMMAPRTLPYAQIVAFVVTVVALIMVGFGLVSPLPALLIGRLGAALADRLRGIVVLLSVSPVARNPTAAVAVVTAIVLAFGCTLADASLIASFKGSWFAWLRSYYHCDLAVTAGGAVADILTARPFSADVVQELREIPGVDRVQAIRRVDIDYGGRPTMLVSLDRVSTPLPVLDGNWEEIRESFWNGQGVLVSDALAHRTGIETGDRLLMNAPSGEVTLPVRAIFRDVFGGDLGAIAISRERYQELWHDPLVDRVHVWTESSPEAVQAEINARYGQAYGVQAVSFETQVSALTDLVDSAFAMTYALVFISLAVSFVAVLNFLLSAILDRRREYRTMLAVGLSPRQVAATVSTEGAVISVTAVLVGLAAGAVVSAVIVLQSVPMVNGWHFDYWFPTATAAAISVGTVVVAAVVGLLPGWYASRPKSSRDMGEE